MTISTATADPLILYGEHFSSRFLLGTALYASPQLMQDAIAAAGCNMITLSLRRQLLPGADGSAQPGAAFWDLVRASGCRLLPNTAGCKTAREAITLAQMSRELFATEWIKLEVIGDDYNLQPDPFGLLEAATELLRQGFKVLPYCTDDLVLCQRLRAAGCEALMPWGAPIGTGQGLLNRYNLRTLRQRLPDLPLIIDAGIGAPSQACEAMEMGFDAVLLNTAVARAGDPVAMARAFASAIDAGRCAWRAGTMEPRQTAVPSTQTLGQPFWHPQRSEETRR